MPFVKRSIYPRNLSRWGSDHYELSSVSNVTLCNALRQLAALALAAEDISKELNEDFDTISVKAAALSVRLCALEKNVIGIDPRNVPVPEGRLLTSREAIIPFRSGLVSNEGLFDPGARPVSLVKLYEEATPDLTGSLRTEIVQEEGCRRPNTLNLDIETRRPASFVGLRDWCSDDETFLSDLDPVSPSLPSKALSLTNEPPIDYKLPSPSERQVAVVHRYPPRVIPIDVSGCSFRRMEIFRQSLIQFEYSKRKRRKKRLKRRNTIADAREARIALPYNSQPSTSSGQGRSTRSGSPSSRGATSYTDHSFDTSETNSSIPIFEKPRHRFLGLEFSLPFYHATSRPADKCRGTFGDFECVNEVETSVNTTQDTLQKEGGVKSETPPPNENLRNTVSCDEGGRSSSGNWSGSSSTRTSLESEGQQNQNNQTGHSPGSSFEQDSIVSESIPTRSLSPSSNQQTYSHTTDDLPSSHTSDGTLTPTQDIQDIPFLDDDTGSAFSCDTEGYYTSFHIDSGLRSISQDHLDSSTDVYDSIAKGSTGTTNSSSASLGTVIMRNPEKKTPPKPPQRVSSLEHKRESIVTVIHVNGSASSSREDVRSRKSIQDADSKSSKDGDSGRETSSSPAESTSPHSCSVDTPQVDAELNASRASFKEKTAIDTSRIPSMCIITPPLSDDESARSCSAKSENAESSQECAAKIQTAAACAEPHKEPTSARHSEAGIPRAKTTDLNSQFKSLSHTAALVSHPIAASQPVVIRSLKTEGYSVNVSSKNLVHREGVSSRNSECDVVSFRGHTASAQPISGIPETVRQNLVITPTSSLERKKTRPGARVTLDSEGKILYTSDSLPRRLPLSFDPGPRTSIIKSSVANQTSASSIQNMPLPAPPVSAMSIPSSQLSTMSLPRDIGSQNPKKIQSISGSLNNSIYGMTQMKNSKETDLDSTSLLTDKERSISMLQPQLAKAVVQELKELNQFHNEQPKTSHSSQEFPQKGLVSQEKKTDTQAPSTLPLKSSQNSLQRQQLLLQQKQQAIQLQLQLQQQQMQLQQQVQLKQKEQQQRLQMSLGRSQKMREGVTNSSQQSLLTKQEPVSKGPNSALQPQSNSLQSLQIDSYQLKQSQVSSVSTTVGIETPSPYNHGTAPCITYVPPHNSSVHTQPIQWPQTSAYHHPLPTSRALTPVQGPLTSSPRHTTTTVQQQTGMVHGHTLGRLTPFPMMATPLPYTQVTDNDIYGRIGMTRQVGATFPPGFGRHQRMYSSLQPHQRHAQGKLQPKVVRRASVAEGPGQVAVSNPSTPEKMLDKKEKSKKEKKKKELKVEKKKKWFWTLPLRRKKKDNEDDDDGGFKAASEKGPRKFLAPESTCSFIRYPSPDTGSSDMNSSSSEQGYRSSPSGSSAEVYYYSQCARTQQPLLANAASLQRSLPSTPVSPSENQTSFVSINSSPISVTSDITDLTVMDLTRGRRYMSREDMYAAMRHPQYYNYHRHSLSGPPGDYGNAMQANTPVPSRSTSPAVFGINPPASYVIKPQVREGGLLQSQDQNILNEETETSPPPQEQLDETEEKGKDYSLSERLEPEGHAKGSDDSKQKTATKQTSLTDFKKMILQQSMNAAVNSSRTSAVEMLRASRPSIYGYSPPPAPVVKPPEPSPPTKGEGVIIPPSSRNTARALLFQSRFGSGRRFRASKTEIISTTIIEDHGGEEEEEEEEEDEDDDESSISSLEGQTPLKEVRPCEHYELTHSTPNKAPGELPALPPDLSIIEPVEAALNSPEKESVETAL